MVDLDGHVLGQEITIQEDDIVQEDPFERGPDDEDYEGYTGNVGASAPHWYRDTVSVSERHLTVKGRPPRADTTPGHSPGASAFSPMVLWFIHCAWRF